MSGMVVASDPPTSTGMGYRSRISRSVRVATSIEEPRMSQYAKSGPTDSMVVRTSLGLNPSIRTKRVS